MRGETKEQLDVQLQELCSFYTFLPAEIMRWWKYYRNKRGLEGKYLSGFCGKRSGPLTCERHLQDILIFNMCLQLGLYQTLFSKYICCIKAGV